eukprot:2541705-Rhodomonas_salina.1
MTSAGTHRSHLAGRYHHMVAVEGGLGMEAGDMMGRREDPQTHQTAAAGDAPAADWAGTLAAENAGGAGVVQADGARARGRSACSWRWLSSPRVAHAVRVVD